MSKIVIFDEENVNVSLVNRTFAEATIDVKRRDGSVAFTLKHFYLNYVSLYDSENEYRGIIDCGQIGLTVRRVRIINSTHLNDNNDGGYLGITVDVFSW